MQRISIVLNAIISQAHVNTLICPQ